MNKIQERIYYWLMYEGSNPTHIILSKDVLDDFVKSCPAWIPIPVEKTLYPLVCGLNLLVVEGTDICKVGILH